MRSWEEPEIVGRSGDQKFFKLTDDRFTHPTYEEDFGGHLRWFCEACQEEILSQQYKDDKNPAECYLCRKQRLPFE